MSKSPLTKIRPLTSLLMCLLLLQASVPSHAGTDSADNREVVGKVTGLASSVLDGGVAVNNKSAVHTKDFYSTNGSGRLRIQLDDGSILGMGAESQLRIIKHDASSGETMLDLSSGRLRSRVVKVRKSGTRFQVVTPHARISVVGTDFFLDVTSRRTQVVVYSGIVLVGTKTGSSAVDVAAGQTTTVDNGGISRLELIAEDFEQETIISTALPGEITPSAEETSADKPRSHLRRNVVIGAAVAAGALVAGLAARRGSSSTQAPSTPTQPTIPSIPPH
jgi:ferric-dicitrate binding protein FerR (iron transport regulator)